MVPKSEIVPVEKMTTRLLDFLLDTLPVVSWWNKTGGWCVVLTIIVLLIFFSFLFLDDYTIVPVLLRYCYSLDQMWKPWIHRKSSRRWERATKRRWKRPATWSQVVTPRRSSREPQNLFNREPRVFGFVAKALNLFFLKHDSKNCRFTVVYKLQTFKVGELVQNNGSKADWLKVPHMWAEVSGSVDSDLHRCGWGWLGLAHGAWVCGGHLGWRLQTWAVSSEWPELS